MSQEQKRPSEKSVAAISETARQSATGDDVDGLRESEAKYRGFIENLAVMFYAAEPRPPYSPIYISPAFAQFGYPLEEWRESMDLWVRILHPDDRRWVLEKTEAAMRAGGETDYEYRLIAQGGDARWVRDRGSFVRDEAGNAICWQGVMIEITADKRIEEALKESERRYRQMFEKNRAIKILIDPATGAIVDVNPAACEFYGYARAEFLTKNIHDLNTLSAEQVGRELERARSERQNYFIFRHRIASGELRDVEVHSSLLREQNRELLYSIVQDVTERRQTEQALRESEERFRALFENANDLIYVRDLEGNYLSINKATERVLGYTREEALSINMRQVVAPEHLECARQMAADEIAGTSKAAYEINCLTKSGSRVTLEVSSTLIYKDEVPIAVQGIARDVTERRRTEQALKEREEQYRDLFENANDLIYVHDLRGNYLSINKATEQAFGYTREEALKMNMRQIAVPEHLDRANRMMADKIGGARQTSYEVDCITKDNRRVTLEVSSALIYKDEVPIAVQGIARDVTERRRTEQFLKEREGQYRDLFENANDLIYTHDLEGNFTSLNRAGEIITGYTRAEALERNLAQVVAPDYLATARRMIASKVSSELPTTYEIEIIAKQGNRVSLELSTRVIYQNGKPVGIQGIGRDISERKRTEQALVNSERRYRALGEGIMHQVWTARPDGEIDYVNGRTLAYCGRTFAEIVGTGWQSVVHPEDLPACLECWQRSLVTGENYETEFRLRRYDGKYRWHQARATVGLDADGEISNWFGTNTDIEDQKLAESKLNHFAGHDTLTNLPNRARFMNHLERAVSRAEHSGAFRFAVLFLDVDRFKVINDSLGHTTGDKLLIAFAKRLEECVRPNDVVARLGGDEFTVLLNNIEDASDAVRVADRFLEKLAAPFNLDSYEVFTSASIGIILSDEVRRQPEDFLRDADTAMYRAKEAGKSRYEIFDREMHIRNMNLLQLETDLRRAIDQNEFQVFYQPVVNLETGAINEFEALIRWQHPRHGLVAPNDFIDIAEETGLIIPIGKWILGEACRQTAEWRNLFPHLNLSISVNLSAKQMMHPDLMKQIREILQRTAFNPRCLKLEVTETVVMENSDKALAVISNLNEIGIELSTDDFGTGYSSLSYLHSFPFDRLKIDRSFVSKMNSDPKSEAIVRTILLLGQNLDIEVVAEGIETAAQFYRLRELGCRTGQGFLFSKPVDAVAAARILSDGLPRDFDSAFFGYGENGGREVVEVDKIQ